MRSTWLAVGFLALLCDACPLISGILDRLPMTQPFGDELRALSIVESVQDDNIFWLIAAGCSGIYLKRVGSRTILPTDGSSGSRQVDGRAAPSSRKFNCPAASFSYGISETFEPLAGSPICCLRNAWISLEFSWAHL